MVQELLGKVVLPSWFETQSTDQNAKPRESGERGGLRNAIQQLKVDEETGTLTSHGERLLLMPVKLMHSIEDLLIKTFGPVAATNFLYEMGKEAGGHSIEFVENAGHKLTSPAKLREARDELAALWGWGRLDAVEFDATTKLVRSRGTGSIYVRNRRGTTPVCHFGRGLVAGALGVVLHRRCESIEVACEGKRDSYCELVTGAGGKIARLVDSLT